MKLRIICLHTKQEASSLDGMYLVEYDPSRDGVAPDGSPMRAHIAVTENYADALDLPNNEMIELFQRVDEREPQRPGDGRPNRPLTAFTVEFMK